MLKKGNSSYLKKLEKDSISAASSNYQSDPNLGILEEYFSNYQKVTIDQQFEIFNDKVLANKSNPNLDVTQGGVDYGVLSLLEGDWYSYIEDDSKRLSNLEEEEKNVIIVKKQRDKDKDIEFKKNIGSGIHTTIMPSPGTTQNNIPGKFSFECDEYIEKLSFDLIPGGIRNRGGANEQFCGAVKYEQSIKSASIESKKISEGNINTSLSIFGNEEKREQILSKYLKSDSDFEEIFNSFNNKETNAYLDKPVKEFINDFILIDILNFKGIHEENGMYLWLSDVMKNPATEDSIKRDRGVHNWDNEQGIELLIKKLYPVAPEANELVKFKEIVKKHPFLDVTLYNVGSIDRPQYVTTMPVDLNKIVSIVPPKELQPGDGIDKPTFVPDYSISRSGVIPHGSTITLLGDLKREGGSFLIPEEPMFVNPSVGTWDKDHLALSDTMGTGISPTNKNRPFDLYNPPLPFTPTEDFNEENDPGEEEVYTQQLFLHNLYPYSVRPDLRLRDAIKNQNIKNHIKVEMFTKKDEGAQGGIVNIPFVNRFVPTVNMKMNMWLETVVEDGKEILQLQYEQIVFFEFGFGDSGGTTSWPHIQVNTLRQAKDLNEYSRKLAVEQFDLEKENKSPQNNTPKDGHNEVPTSESKPSVNAKYGNTGDISKCPFHNSQK